MIREIFVVDDNVDYQFIFFKLLKELHKAYSVKFFANGKACQTHIETMQFKNATNMPSLIIIDMNMPGMNGLQLLKSLKNPLKGDLLEMHEIPVLMMSSDFTDSQIHQCYQAGANAVIFKPTNFNCLRTTIHSICRFWLDREEALVAKNHQ